MTKNKCIKCGGNIKKNYNPEPLDKPSARILCDRCYGENSVPPESPTTKPPRNYKPLWEDKKKCDHLYREFRVENASDIILTVYFYCQKCLDIQVKRIELKALKRGL